MKIRLSLPDFKDSSLAALLVLTGFFILLEISFFIQCNSVYLADFSFISNHLHVPVIVAKPVAWFLLTQLLIHFIYCLIIWRVSLSVTELFNLSDASRLTLAIALWVLGIAIIITANQYYFPHSKFAELSEMVLFSPPIVKTTLCVLLTLFGVVLLFMLLEMIKNTSKLLLCIFAVSLTALYFLPSEMAHFRDAGTDARPNVIIIGVDSLRPDFLSFFGGVAHSPFIDSYLNQAVVFSDAVTPLARTFPSWVSILTGEYPQQIGVRSNLAKQSTLGLNQTLPAELRKKGYETIYATDETRFSNIDKHFGFDNIISPPMGLNDFLIGTFNDFPMSNLLVNTKLGKWLFPYSYANRPVHFTYDPDTFIHQLSDGIAEKRSKPLFLAVHFCLPHAPYYWATMPRGDFSPQERYVKSIERADQQVRDFFLLLKERGLLEHAILVLLSDHGEALELKGDRITEKELFNNKTIHPPQFYPPSLEKEEFNQSAGHGTDVLGLAQYHTLLAFKLYGANKAQPSIQPGVVSMVDIKPTILDLLGLFSPGQLSLGNESLAPIISGKQQHVVMLRHVFLESDYSPESIRTVYPEIEKVVLEGVQLFQVDHRTLRLTVRDDMNKMIISSKQYADIYDEWMLALYPQSKTSRMPILVNLVSGEWTNDLRSPFAQRSPAFYMLEALQSFYGAEIGEI